VSKGEETFIKFVCALIIEEVSIAVSEVAPVLITEGEFIGAGELLTKCEDGLTKAASG
jgi:hypothetical protein